uniref:QERAS neuropeptide n=1 Tax=Platynereis dumerilii TaxID=6359 RepID=V5TE09_PLADU|nr:QERAS neuropeptide precursor [Platynereis dumerilii]
MEKIAVFLLVATIALAFSASINQADALYLPTNRVMKRSAAAAAANNHVKISSPRQKRYTDYQERASAFCTGLCMYEERKSYSECFDLCNYY